MSCIAARIAMSMALRRTALAIVMLGADIGVVHAGCSRGLTDTFVTAERLVGSLRPEKGGQARVFAYDGSVYTAGEAIWMKGQLRQVQTACAQNDDRRAAPYLESVLGLLRTRHNQP